MTKEDSWPVEFILPSKITYQEKGSNIENQRIELWILHDYGFCWFLVKSTETNTAFWEANVDISSCHFFLWVGTSGLHVFKKIREVPQNIYVFFLQIQIEHHEKMKDPNSFVFVRFQEYPRHRWLELFVFPRYIFKWSLFPSVSKAWKHHTIPSSSGSSWSGKKTQEHVRSDWLITTQDLMWKFEVVANKVKVKSELQIKIQHVTFWRNEIMMHRPEFSSEYLMRVGSESL